MIVMVILVAVAATILVLYTGRADKKVEDLLVKNTALELEKNRLEADIYHLVIDYGSAKSIDIRTRVKIEDESRRLAMAMEEEIFRGNGQEKKPKGLFKQLEDEDNN